MVARDEVGAQSTATAGGKLAMRQYLICPSSPCDLALAAEDVARIAREADCTEESVLDVEECLGVCPRMPEAPARVVFLRSPEAFVALRVHGPLDTTVAAEDELLTLPQAANVGGLFGQLLTNEGLARALVLDTSSLARLVQTRQTNGSEK